MEGEQVEFAVQLNQWAELLLIWVGFGTLAGLLAKGIMPGKDPGGAIATLAMGIGGTVIGCGVLTFFYEGQRVTPISPIGFVVATAGAFIILFFYRLLAGFYIDEGNSPRPSSRKKLYSRRDQRDYAYDDVE